MTDWQPIETIPKGEPDEYGDRKGPLVLVWIPDKGFPWVARWVSEHDREEICSTYSESMAAADGDWHVQLDGHPRPQFNPTHWAALPKGPA